MLAARALLHFQSGQYETEYPEDDRLALTGALLTAELYQHIHAYLQALARQKKRGRAQPRRHLRPSRHRRH